MDIVDIERTLTQAIARGGISAEGTALAMFYDLEELEGGLREIERVFPEGALHTAAVKANRLGPILQLVQRAGFGAECASRGELALALEAGFAAKDILFDSPAKTRSEIEFALGEGMNVNVDNLQELERVAQAIASRPTRSIVGLRINPQVGAGTIASTSTATATSKFGITLDEHRAEIMAAFARYPWLRGLHVHVGSQGCGIDLLVRGARRAVDLALELERGGHTIELLDIGGGLSVDYGDTDRRPAFAEYAEKLRAEVPELFDGRRRIATEFGRAIHAKTGWVASRVEYTKSAGGHRIAVTHAGADLFVRTAYLPDKWPHRITVHDPSGARKTGPLSPWDVAGPLCFSGDLLATARELPPIEPGDFVVVHDAGAYTLSMWSCYNSRVPPQVFGYRGAEISLLTASSAN
jgi:diaminopimelate decarboxylase